MQTHITHNFIRQIWHLSSPTGFRATIPMPTVKHTLVLCGTASKLGHLKLERKYSLVQSPAIWYLEGEKKFKKILS